MKPLVTVFKCFLLAMIVGSALGDQEGGATSATAARVCPPETREQDSPMFLKLISIGKSCYEELVGNTTKWQQQNVTTESIQTYFNSMCLNEISLQQCLADKVSSLELCEDKTVQKTFGIYRELIVKTIESGCAEGAKRFVALLQGVKLIPASSPLDHQFEMCGLKSFIVVMTVVQSNVDSSSRLFILHKEISTLEKCLSKIEMPVSMKEEIDYFANELKTTMKCIHPQDGTLVACTSIDVSLISVPSICEVKTHGSNLDLHDFLENEAGRCFYKIMTYDDRDIETSNNDAVHSHLNDYCSMKKEATNCPRELLLYSDICHNGPEKNEFKMLIEFVLKGVEAACFEDGRRVADIMFEVYRLKQNGQGHAVWDCVDVAKSVRNEINEHRSSSKNMRFYHELEAFKGCLVNKLQGHQTSVDAATSLIDELLKKMECPGVEEGSKMTCESLMSHQNHHHHHDHH